MNSPSKRYFTSYDKSTNHDKISVNPPSAVISDPTQYDESADARNRAAYAISLADHNLFIGILVKIFDAILSLTSADNPT
jgi:hypothetical protein